MAYPYRFTAPADGEPVLHELPPLRLPEHEITLHLRVRQDGDGGWRAGLLFVEADAPTRETAEIFVAASETELWQAVDALSEHHLRALYLSLA